METNIFTQITTREFSPALKVATVLGGIVALFVAMRVGQVLIKRLFGLLALAILGGAAWWFSRATLPGGIPPAGWGRAQTVASDGPHDGSLLAL